MKLALIALLAACAGCIKGGQFTCTSDADCDRAGVQGTCQGIGFCSFADGACASGQRFADFSGTVSNQCVGDTPIPDGPLPDTPAGFFRVGGTVTGLSGTLKIQNNGGDELTRTTDGAFQFPAALADGANFLVTISAQPAAQTCFLANGTGMIAGADANGVEISCGSLSTSTILCAAATTCAIGTEYCCLDPAAGSGVCNTTNQCGGKRVECDSADDCGGGGNVCCASYSNQNAFRGAQCQTAMFCIPVMGFVVELWCDPAAGAAACPVGKTCTGAPAVNNPGYKRCVP